MEDITPINEIKEKIGEIDFKHEVAEVKQEVIPVEKDKATEMVDEAFGQAVAFQVANNQKVQDDLLKSAGKVIENKANAIKSQAEQEEKEAHFKNNVDACECFGYSEKTTEKWAVNYMKFWHRIFTAIWITLGWFTFAPITFISKKLKVILKHTWLCIVIALIIYGIIALSPIWINIVKGALNNGL